MSQEPKNFEFAIIGAGIAGISTAAKLAERDHSVLVLEQDVQFPQGATGRSAALFAESYFSDPSFAHLTKATRPMLEHPPQGFTDVPLMTPRGAIYVAGEDDAPELGKLCEKMGQAGISLPKLYRKDVLELVPYLRPEKVIWGVLEEGAQDMDVHAIYQAYLRRARTFGATIVGDAELISAHWDGQRWILQTKAGAFTADVVVNAAGAWVDVIACRCGIKKKRLTPKRRTAMTTAVTPETQALLPARSPFVFKAKEDLYFCQRGNGFLVSPSDETPSGPCDAQPEDEDVARALDAFESMTTLEVIAAKPKAWAGLRTFARDKRPVVGFEPCERRFFWLAGQGGYGIQTCDAMAKLAAGLLLDGTVPLELLRLGLKASDVSPDRFRIMA
jgi:D-arginine dehydrogenase